MFAADSYAGNSEIYGCVGFFVEFWPGQEGWVNWPEQKLNLSSPSSLSFRFFEPLAMVFRLLFRSLCCDCCGLVTSVLRNFIAPANDAGRADEEQEHNHDEKFGQRL